MSSDRQGESDGAWTVRSLGLRLPANHRLPSHAHPWGQIVYATSGVMDVRAKGGRWVVPPQRAAWVPAGQQHSVETHGAVRMQTLYLRPDVSEQLPAGGAVLAVTPLLRELILEAMRIGMLREDVAGHRALLTVLLDQIHVTPTEPLELVWPRDVRAEREARNVSEHIDSDASLAEFAVGSGASVRTLERLFVRETGLTFGRWRQQARVLFALRHLAAGDSVTKTALAVGFSGTSAFVAMFRRILGVTPGRYFQDSPQ